MDKYHTPLFAAEIVALLQAHNCKIIVDGTCGEGGHTLTFLKAGMQVISMDYDTRLIERAQGRLNKEGFGDTKVQRGNFAQMQDVVRRSGHGLVDAVLFDVGISLHHIKALKKGFSYDNSEPLDMRADSSATETASDYINKLTESELYELIATGSEITSSRRLAHLIIERRGRGPLTTVGDLRMIVKQLGYSDKEETMILARLMQAFRIAVNNELGSLKEGLIQASELVRSGGLVITITFHSLEDRMVKLYFKKRSDFSAVLSKPHRNLDLPFAESAQLRVYAKQ
ncbi:16S rRNA (cytosine(1402)-N(4))-methyltransferase [Candidatus Roizmanbacteria bacterium CG10_big_fil_rev_8_21_14_0_10_45_7]|uniref:16S rRNA (Cytosine(1402)-N(4))-methyltransferase n=1 Tax=Candidatus Roizmanbacteria bacterium CG10_big_fil_rev_8_21_14_0_10_45_7 TaxID=1974854 RepID=A0A2M8KUK5_9BACT|nr:MAG: 16S rRNA (cytosine(1402)-N(4))-methyltransferase [Candidatus Roizmanbacteria bacterium CG10_big_fil_rev_8_21_14_0_10_45_7]